MLNKCCRIAKCCIDVVVCLLISLLLFIVGLIVGAYTSLATILGLGAIIAIITLLLILLIIRIVNLICCKNKKQNNCYDYDNDL